MPYSYITWSGLRSALATRLNDSGMTFWVSAELTSILTEALRTWNAYTLYWRDRGGFQTSASTAFYDLTTVLLDGSGIALLGQTVTDRAIVTDLEYALLEPANNWSSSSVWDGTAMFTMQQIVDTVQRQRDRFLKDSGCYLSTQTVAMAAIPGTRIQLPQTVIDVRRAAYVNTSGAVTPLIRSTPYEFNAYSPKWSINADTPAAYSLSAAAPLILELAPAPLDTGTLHLVTVNSGAALDVTTGVALGIPDDLSWIVKWGALAALLSADGPSHDEARARYATERYRQGVELARAMPTVINAQFAAVDLQVNTLTALDRYNPSWQSAASTAVPTDIGTAGANMVGISPLPNGVYSVTMDVVRNAPIPSADGDLLQLAPEDLSAILDYAEHLAAFKMGGYEFMSTSDRLDRFLNAARVYNDRLNAISNLDYGVMFGMAQRGVRAVPRRMTDAAIQPMGMM